MNMSEKSVESYFDESDEQYRLLWNPDGSKHWGYFDNLKAADCFEDFLRASDHWSQMLEERSKISASSNVLEIGCANGVVSKQLAEHTGASVTGIDISGGHIQKAKTLHQENSALKLDFYKASATALPFDDNTFSHVWSQSTFSHIADNNAVLREAFRVLKRGGLLIFDDVVVPNKQTSDLTQEKFFDRLFISLKLTPEEYASSLKTVGFTILESENLSQHMKKCYEIQAGRTKTINQARSEINQQHYTAIANQEIGWYYFLCQK